MKNLYAKWFSFADVWFYIAERVCFECDIEHFERLKCEKEHLNVGCFTENCRFYGHKLRFTAPLSR